MKERLIIEDYGMDGVGIAHGAKTYFLPNTLLGEEVEVENGVCKIIKKSVNRTQPICPYYYECGGCNLQCFNKVEQQVYKTKHVQNCLHKFKINFNKKINYVNGEQTYYRNKISFAVREENGKNKIGLFVSKTHKIVEIKECLITNKLHAKLLEVFRKYLSLKNVFGFNEETKQGNIKNIVVRFCSSGVLVCVVGVQNNFPAQSEFITLLQNAKINFSLSYCFNKNNKTILSNNIQHIFGDEDFIVHKNGLDVPINIASFVQVNDEISSAVYDYVVKQIDKKCTVLDLYSGAGLMTAMLSKNASSVIGIEQNKFAVLASQKLFLNNNIKNAQCLCGKCEDVITNLMQNKKQFEMTNKSVFCVLDPPRKGCNSSVLESIKSANVEKIIYVSCEPITLSRDLKILESNYEIQSITLFDMFSLTSNVETVAVLKRK